MSFCLKSVKCLRIRSNFSSSTSSAVSCPYSEMNLNKESLLPDRLSGEMPAASPIPRNRKVETNERSTSPVIK